MKIFNPFKRKEKSISVPSYLVEIEEYIVLSNSLEDPLFKRIRKEMKEVQRLLHIKKGNELVLDVSLYTCIPSILSLTKNYKILDEAPAFDGKQDEMQFILLALANFCDVLSKINYTIALDDIQTDNEVLSELAERAKKRLNL